METQSTCVNTVYIITSFIARGIHKQAVETQATISSYFNVQHSSDILSN